MIEETTVDIFGEEAQDAIHAPMVADEELDATTAPAPAEKKERMFVIEIDEVEGFPNFEKVGVNGKIYKIKRGEEVTVPQSVVHVLQNAVAERLLQTDAGGRVTTTRQRYSAIPDRIIRGL